jgi:outer membrane lipoprotein LolB
MGKGFTRITLDQHTMEITQQDTRERYPISDARQALRERFEIELPLDQFRFWLRGQPAPATPFNQTLHEDQSLASLSQDNWQINYDRYKGRNGYWLPHKLTARYPGLRLVLAITDWNS